MKIKLEKRDNLYYADLLDLPGTPPVGNGHTKLDAIFHLFQLVITSGWIRYADFDSLEIIEDEPSQPLLSLNCVMELRLTGEVTQEAFDRLLEFLKVTGELWGLQVERQEDNK